VSAPARTGRDAAGLLAECVRHRSSGILTATRGRLRRLFCLDAGRLVFAASNLIEEQFDEHLVRTQLLTPRQRAEAKVHAAKAGLKLGPYLHAQGTVEPAALEAAAREHARGLLEAALALPDAEAVFAPGRPNVAGELTVEQSCVAPLLRQARSSAVTPDQLRARIGPPDTRLRPTAAVAEILRGHEPDALERYLLERSDGTREVSALLAETPDELETTLRALACLMALGALEAAAREESAPKKKAGQLTREECLARLHAAEQVEHYGLLGLEGDAGADEIRESYYLLARRYHPDRFRTEELADLLPQMEAYFTRVTEAYNTLNDPTLRQRYDEERQSTTRKKAPEQDAAYMARQNYARARTLIEKRRFNDAVTFLENAVQLQDGEALYHFELGRVLAQNPRHRAEAEERLRRAIDLDPTHVEARFELGRLLHKAARTEDAVRMLREALQWAPEHAGAQELLDEIEKSPGGLLGGLFRG